MPLVQANISVLKQLQDVVKQLSNAQLACALPVLHQTSIGKHSRHILDFYTNLLNGLDGVIYYDNRHRDGTLETDVQATLDYITQLKTELLALETTQPLEVVISVDALHAPKMASSMPRELAYAMEHTIHHLALIKIGLSYYFKDVELPINFGIAVSTQVYLQQK